MSSKDAKNCFEVKLDVSRYHADDLKVNVHNRELIISGQHSERHENGSTVERHFIRTFILPKNAREEELSSELTAEGILNVSVPIDELPDYRKIPIKVDPNWKMQSNPCQALIVREPIPLWWW
ncbi:unnamed protein product [Thelazia callipaeda]|uniref:SHSP domain-containing protein n=1 Tax=Thelazia callipaeda TaxID=103827 RepID=A0A0N5D7S6_THECL|nr:unnamed protein product [Thelazia callipaeda]